MITISDAARNSLNISKKAVALVRLHYGDGTNFLTLASGKIGPEWTEVEYRPLLTAPPSTLSKVDILTSKFAAGVVKIQVSNGDYHPDVKFSDIIGDTTLGAGNDIGFENRQYEVRLWTPGLTQWSECPQYFNGTTRDIGHNAVQVQFSVQDKREIIHFELGVLLTDADAADPNEGLPEVSLDKIQPIVMGDHIFDMANDSKAIDTSSPANDLVPCIYLGLTDDDVPVHQYFVMSAEADDLGIAAGQNAFWGWDQNLKRSVRVHSTITIVQNTAQGAIISIPASPQFMDYWYPKGVATSDSTDEAFDFVNSGGHLIADPDDRTFITDTGNWDDTDAGVSINTTGDGHLVFAAVATGDGAEIDLSGFPLTQGVDYLVRIFVDSYGSGSFKPILGGTDGTTRSSAADFREVITAGAGDFLRIQAVAAFTGNIVVVVCSVDDIGNIADKDFTTFARGELGVSSTPSSADFTEVQVNFPAYDTSLDFVTNIVIYWYGELTKNNGDFADVTITVDGGGHVVEAVNTEPTGASYPDLRLEETAAASASDILGGITFRMAANTGILLADEYFLDIYMMYLGIVYTPETLLPLLWAGKGRKYSFTRGGHDEAVTGNLVENPAGSVETMYRDELAVPVGEIDTAAFDTSSDDLTEWKFAFSITKLTKSLVTIAKMAQDCRSFVWLKPDATISMKTIKDTYSASDRTLDFRDLINPTFTRTSPKNIYTAVDVRYDTDWRGKKTAATGIIEDTVFQTKYNITEAQSTLIYNADNISEATTANLLRAFLLAQWKQMHNIITFSAGIKYIDLDIGDVIDFDNVPSNIKAFGLDITATTKIPPTTGQNIYPFWWIFSVNRSITGVTIKAFQLHELS